MFSPSAIKRIVKPLVPQFIRERVYAYRKHQFANSMGVTLRYTPESIEIRRAEAVLKIGRRHEVYLMDMIQYFDYYFGAVQASGNVVDYSIPQRHRVVGFDDFPVLFPSIPEPFVTIRQYLEFAALKPGDVVLDLGAYAGLTSIAFAQEVGPTGAVFAFEADAENNRVAQENIDTAVKSGYPPVHLINKAVWSHNDGLSFSVEGAMGSSAASIVGDNRGSVTMVPSTTLDSFLRERGVARVDFIKMDIEGAEVPVLDSSQRCLLAMRPKLIIEPHFVGGVLTTDHCCQTLRELGVYDVRVINQEGVSLPLVTATPR